MHRARERKRGESKILCFLARNPVKPKYHEAFSMPDFVIKGAWQTHTQTEAAAVASAAQLFKFYCKMGNQFWSQE